MIAHALKDPQQSGVARAVCKCGAKSEFVLSSKAKRFGWQRDHVNAVMDGWQTTPVVAHRAQATYRQVWHWVDQGYLRPEPVSSKEFRWSEDESDVAVEMARLVRVGFTPVAAVQLARQVVDHGMERLDLGYGLTLRIVE